MIKMIAGNTRDGGQGFVIYLGKAKVVAPVGLIVKGPSRLQYNLVPDMFNHKFVYLTTEADVATYDSLDQIETMEYVIHIDRDAIINNQQTDNPTGVITIFGPTSQTSCSDVDFVEPVVLKYDKIAPRLPSKTAWIETNGGIIIRR
jgi:hypothetical protein